MHGPSSNIEVIILAYNEEVNIPFALASVSAWADAVHVVDSGSTDRTRALAGEHGASVVDRPWLGYAAQKNWALDNLPIKADWVFILDSDESITTELRDELIAKATRPVDEVPESGFYVNRLTSFMGKPIRHCGFFPSYNLRFFKRGKARYEEREVHEHMAVSGPSGRLKGMMLHEDRRGLEHFIAKHNRYSTLEAREIRKATRAAASDEHLPELEKGVAFRRWLKRNVQPKLPFPAFWRFFYMYILRLGFLDGLHGLRLCVLIAMYDQFISLKLAELRWLDRAQTTPPRGSVANPGGLAIPEGQLEPLPTVRAEKALPALPTIAPALPPPTPAAPFAAAAIVHKPAASDGNAPEPRRPQADTLVQELNPTHLPKGDWPGLRSVPVSILVPVKNEKRNIVECLRRCQWANELVVVDSQSTDQTIELAQAMGADVYQFHYNRAVGWPKKKNWALDSVPWKNEWVMILDADEYMTPELAREIERVVGGTWVADGGTAKPGCGDGYWVNRRFMFFGQWIRGCGYYPSWNVRLLKHRLGRYERIGTLGDTGSGDNEVHEHITLSTGKAGYLKHEFLHYAYPDLTVWIEKHNRYTSWEAHAMEAKDAGSVRANLFGEPIERGRWIKRYARKMPFRPTLRFIYSYILRSGWRDGYAGFVMCRLLAWYEFVSIAKYREKLALKSERARREAEMTSGKTLS